MLFNFNNYQEILTDLEFNALKDNVESFLLQMNYVVKSIDIIVVNNNEILEINKKYLNHHFFTDVITFDYSNNKRVIESSLVISLEMIKSNADKFGTTEKIEFIRVVFHGILHLVGYKDKNKNEIKMMRKMEDVLLEKYMFHVKQQSSD